MPNVHFRFTFGSQGDYELAIRALDRLHLEQLSDARNDLLREDQRSAAAQSAAQADRLRLELRNLAEQLYAPCGHCLDRPGYDGLGRACRHCGGTGRAAA